MCKFFVTAEQDGFVVQDPNGYELVSAAINSNLRDAGRLGQLMLNDGYLNGQQIIPKSVVQIIKKGGSIEKFKDSKRGKVFKNYSYINQWWHTDKAAFLCLLEYQKHQPNNQCQIKENHNSYWWISFRVFSNAIYNI